MNPSPRRIRVIFNVFALLAIAAPLSFLMLPGCKKAPAPEQTVVADTSDIYSLITIRDRKKKDLAFLKEEQSPIKAEDKNVLQGLAYYPVDRAFVFSVVLERKRMPEIIVIATSKDKPREMLNIGSFAFTSGGVACTLQVYQPKDTTADKYWFIPFTDATNGAETYHGGRFIDIEHPTSDAVTLDFNLCYNPYCAYNDRYDCPIPPRANTLPIAVKAGEKNYPLAKH